LAMDGHNAKARASDGERAAGAKRASGCGRSISARLRMAERATVDNLRCDQERRLVDQTGAGWNSLMIWLRHIAALRRAA